VGRRTRALGRCAVLTRILADDLEAVAAGFDDAGRFDDAVVLVTGCAGFLGCTLMQFLVRRARRLRLRRVIGLDTFALDRPRWLDDLAREAGDVLVLRRFDIARDSLAELPEAHGARFVLHLASIAAPSLYRRFPLATIDANVWGLRGLLEFYRDAPPLRGLLFFSSSEVYGDPDPANVPTDESYRGNVAMLGPRACYDEAKRFGETLCEVFARQHGLPIVIVRPFNNYGPGMRPGDTRLPADLARCVMAGEDMVLHSDGTPTRTFCYAADAATGFLRALVHESFDAFNIGADAPELSVRAFAEIFRAVAVEHADYHGALRHAPHAERAYLTDVPLRRCPSIRKARATLGYAPRVDVREGVRRYLAHLAEEAA
jgi:UDP-glucuronate decarboxylase